MKLPSKGFVGTCECSAVVAGRSNFNKHCRLCPSASLAFHCSVCQRGFARRGALIQHELKAHQIAPPAEVSVHLLSNFRDRCLFFTAKHFKFSCSRCFANFTQAGTLKVHVKNYCPGPATPLPMTTLQSSLMATPPPAPGPSSTQATAGSHQLGGAGGAAAERSAVAESTKRGKKRSQDDQE
jgi:hypothetical protein